MLEKIQSFDWIPKPAIRAIALVLGALAIFLMYEATTHQVVLELDGSQLIMDTHARTVAALLKDAQFEYSESDYIWPPLDHEIGSGDLVKVISAHPVAIQHEGEQFTVDTYHQHPENILNEAGVLVYPGDTVLVNGSPNVSSNSEFDGLIQDLEIIPGAPITLIEGSSRKTIRTSANTVGEALWNQAIFLREGDRTSPSLEAPIESGMSIRLLRARPVRIESSGATRQIWSSGNTVGEILASANMPLQGLDYSIPSQSAAVPEDGTIRVVRVEEEIINELEPIPFETVYQPVEDLEIDSLQVLDAGKFGVLSNQVRIRYEDGEETNRTVEDAIVAVEPEPRRVGYGTKIVVRTLSTSNGTIEYWRAIPVYATSYSPCNLGVSWCGSRTASGAKVDRGVIGVIRSWYNAMQGWPVYVPSYGPGTIEDIGAGIAGKDWIDLGFTDEEIEAWHHWTTLYFLTPVPPAENILWILP